MTIIGPQLVAAHLPTTLMGVRLGPQPHPFLLNERAC